MSQGKRFFALDGLIIATAVVAALVLIPRFFSYEKTHENWSKTDSQRVLEMREVERREVEENLRRLTARCADDQKKLIDLHNTVAGDAELELLLSQYHAWLQDVSPSERADIRDAKGIEKIAIIEDILVQQEFERQSVEVTSSMFRGRVSAETLGKLPANVTYEEVARMADVIVNKMSEESQKRYRQLQENEYAGVEDEFQRKIVAVTEVLWPVRPTRSSPSSSGGDRKDKGLSLIEILASGTSVLESSVQEYLKTVAPKVSAALVIALLRKSPYQLYQRVPASDGELQTFFASNKLSTEDRFLLMQMSALRATVSLKMLYLAEADDDRIPPGDAVRARQFVIDMRETERFPIGFFSNRSRSRSGRSRSQKRPPRSKGSSS